MKIPTLLAIDMLLVAIALGIFLYFYYNKTENEIKANLAPSFISVVNKTDTQGSIVYETHVETASEILWGDNQFLEFTPKQASKKTKLHFMTLNKLKPNTTYFFKIKSGDYTYPNNTLSFKTYPEVEGLTLTYKPIIGAILNPTLIPVNDALVILKISNAEDLVTTTSKDGIFILPLKELREKNSNNPKILNAGTKAQIIASSDDIKSTVEILIPPKSEILPPIILGQNSDFTNIIKKEKNIYDLNSDGQTNSLDLAIIRNSFGRQSNNPSDLNRDGVIDQKDVDLIRNQLTN